MKKTQVTRYRKPVALFLAVALTSASLAAPATSPDVAQAAAKPKLASAKGTILTGESQTVAIKNVKKKTVKKLTVSTSKKSVATVKKSGKTAILIQSKKAGKATISVKLTLKNKKKYSFKYKATVSNTVDRMVPLTKTDGTSTTMKLRYFAKTPHVPYVRITDFYRQLSGGHPLDVKQTGDGEYFLTAQNGATATINTNTDVLESDELGEFGRVYPPEEGEMPINTDYGGAPFLQPLPDVVLRESNHVSVSYADYGLDLLADTNDVWLPVETAAHTFSTGYGASIAYVGHKLYHFTNYITVTNLTSTDFFKEYLSSFPNNVRPVDIADYAYRELMFLFGAQYGVPGRCYFSDAIKEKGLDRALSETDDQTRAVRDMLKSTSLEEYYLGLSILDDMLFDGGHTDLDYFSSSVYMNVIGVKTENEFIDKLKEAADRIGYTLQNTPEWYWPLYGNIVKNKGWKDFDYHEDGDTAVYSMGSMGVDADAWNTYYEKGGDIPNDSYGYFIQYLKKASENKAIKNFVIDLTSNVGGDCNVLSGMMQIIAGESSTYFEQTKTGKRIQCPFYVDTNLDGKFDEKDKEVKYPFRFAVLISRCSFSCGNLFPAVAKEHGVMILGQTSGGGNCILDTFPLGDGLPCYISGPFQMVTREFINTDAGTIPDKELEIKTNDDGTLDYSAFYDISALSRYINEFYK